MDENVKQVCDKYIKYLEERVSPQTNSKRFILGIVGLIASGKTTIARLIAEKRPGTAIIRSDSIRYLLKQADLDWKYVEVISEEAMNWLMTRGHSVIVDRDFVEADKREIVQVIADSFDATFSLIHIQINKNTALERLILRWDHIDEGIIKQDINDFVVDTRGKDENFHTRAVLHKSFDPKLVKQQIYNINNEVSIDGLENEVDHFIDEFFNDIS